MRECRNTAGRPFPKIEQYASLRTTRDGCSRLILPIETRGTRVIVVAQIGYGRRWLWVVWRVDGREMRTLTLCALQTDTAKPSVKLVGLVTLIEKAKIENKYALGVAQDYRRNYTQIVCTLRF